MYKCLVVWVNVCVCVTMIKLTTTVNFTLALADIT